MDSSVRASMDFNGPLNTLSMSPSNKYIAVGGRDGTLLLRGPRWLPVACLASSRPAASNRQLILPQCSRSWRLKPLGSPRSGICAWASPTSILAPTTSGGILVRGRCRFTSREPTCSLLLRVRRIRVAACDCCHQRRCRDLEPPARRIQARTRYSSSRIVHAFSSWTIGSLSERVLSGHRRAVNRICWHPDGNLLISGSQDGTIKLWVWINSLVPWIVHALTFVMHATG